MQRGIVTDGRDQPEPDRLGGLARFGGEQLAGIDRTQFDGARPFQKGTDGGGHLFAQTVQQFAFGGQGIGAGTSGIAS
ncbi:hypothetical protein GCM10020258_48090 [Sphingomonas yabuuchiae]